MKRLERDREPFLIAWYGSKIVVYLIGGWDGWRGNMYRMVVDPQHLHHPLWAASQQKAQSHLYGNRRDPHAVYLQRANHDPDGETDGFSIVVSK